jgi:hypothetical protein
LQGGEMSSEIHNKDIKPDAMRELRIKILTTPPFEFGIKPTSDFKNVYGVLMDWPVGKEIMTVVSLCDGNASLYTTSTFGVIGGFAHEQVRNQAIEFVKCGAEYYIKGKLTSDFSYPQFDKIRFYLLTFNGVMLIEISDKDISDKSNKILKLFAYGQLVITELRKLVENDSNEDDSSIKKEWVGESGYVNCLLTIMSKGILSSVEILKDKVVPNLIEITGTDKASQRWIKKQDFEFNSLNSSKVIKIIKKSIGIKGFSFSARDSFLTAIHAQNDGKNIARIFEISIGPFDKFAKIKMAPDTDPKVIEFQKTVDKQKNK